MIRFEFKLDWRDAGFRSKLLAMICMAMMTTFCSCTSTGRFALSNPFKQRVVKTKTIAKKETKPKENILEELKEPISVKAVAQKDSPIDSFKSRDSFSPFDFQEEKPDLKTAEVEKPNPFAKLTQVTQNENKTEANQNPFVHKDKIQQVSGTTTDTKVAGPFAEEQPIAVKTVARVGMPTKKSIQQASHNGPGNFPWVDETNGELNVPKALPANSMNLSADDWPRIDVPRIPADHLEKMNSPERIADEYLFDGGDRKMGVHYSPYTIDGLNTEDTVAIFNDSQGKRTIKKTNRVAIYSPRFAAVRTISEPIIHDGINKVSGTVDAIRTTGINNRLKPGIEQENLQLQQSRVRSRVSGIEVDNTTGNFNQIAKTANHEKLTNTFEEHSQVGTKQLDHTTIAKTSVQLQAAITWTRDLNPVITAADQHGQVLISKFLEEEMVGLEVNKKPGYLKIMKLADKRSAVRGEIVTFTIHYANTGELDLTKIQIVDNLTARLEFIEDSGSSDRNGKLLVEDNGQGSLILQWDITEPLKGGETGVVTFKARVR